MIIPVGFNTFRSRFDKHRLAEAVLFIVPESALTRVRSFAAELTKSIYKEERLPRVPEAGFYDLVKKLVFEDCVSKSLKRQI